MSKSVICSGCGTPIELREDGLHLQDIVEHYKKHDPIIYELLKTHEILDKERFE